MEKILISLLYEGGVHMNNDHKNSRTKNVKYKKKQEKILRKTWKTKY